MAKTFTVKIILPDGAKFTGDTEMAVLTGPSGEFSITENHISFISPVSITAVILFSDRNEKTISHVFATTGGICEMKDNVCTLLLHTAELSHEIDMDRARKAKDRAEKRLSYPQDIDVQRAQIALRRAVNRIHIAKEHARD